jgi:hypothetical protein
MTTTRTAPFTLILTEEERTELLDVLEQAVVDAHAEKHRAADPEDSRGFFQRERLLRVLLDKVREP